MYMLVSPSYWENLWSERELWKNTKTFRECAFALIMKKKKNNTYVFPSILYIHTYLYTYSSSGLNYSPVSSLISTFLIFFFFFLPKSPPPPPPPSSSEKKKRKQKIKINTRKSSRFMIAPSLLKRIFFHNICIRNTPPPGRRRRIDGFGVVRTWDKWKKMKKKERSKFKMMLAKRFNIFSTRKKRGGKKRKKETTRARSIPFLHIHMHLYKYIERFPPEKKSGEKYYMWGPKLFLRGGKLGGQLITCIYMQGERVW